MYVLYNSIHQTNFSISSISKAESKSLTFELNYVSKIPRFSPMECHINHILQRINFLSTPFRNNSSFPLCTRHSTVNHTLRHRTRSSVCSGWFSSIPLCLTFLYFLFSPLSFPASPIFHFSSQFRRRSPRGLNPLWDSS